MIKKISLYEIDPIKISEMVNSESLPKDIDLSAKYFYWVSSVDVDNEAVVQQYLSLVQDGDIEQLVNFQTINSSMIYSVLAKKKSLDGDYYLLSFQIEEMEHPVLLKVSLIKGVKVAGLKSNQVGLNFLPKNISFDVIKNLFR